MILSGCALWIQHNPLGEALLWFGYIWYKVVMSSATGPRVTYRRSNIIGTHTIAYVQRSSSRMWSKIVLHAWTVLLALLVPPPLYCSLGMGRSSDCHGYKSSVSQEQSYSAVSIGLMHRGTKTGDGGSCNITSQPPMSSFKKELSATISRTSPRVALSFISATTSRWT